MRNASAVTLFGAQDWFEFRSMSELASDPIGPTATRARTQLGIGSKTFVDENGDGTMAEARTPRMPLSAIFMATVSRSTCSRIFQREENCVQLLCARQRYPKRRHCKLHNNLKQHSNHRAG